MLFIQPLILPLDILNTKQQYNVDISILYLLLGIFLIFYLLVVIPLVLSFYRSDPDQKICDKILSIVCFLATYYILFSVMFLSIAFLSEDIVYNIKVESRSVYEVMMSEDEVDFLIPLEQHVNISALLSPTLNIFLFLRQALLSLSKIWTGTRS